jgi:hypothetical protein
VIAARAAVVSVLAAAAVAGCADLDTDVTTSPTAHESPPLPPPPLIDIAGGRYLGGTGLDVIDDMAVGSDGNLYIVGGTASLDFPITLGPPLDTSAPADCPACPFDGFIASVAPSGALRWARLIQTAGYDRLRSIVVQGSNVWVAGSAGEGDLAPTGFHGGADPERGAQDGVLCHFTAGTGELTGCRYVGGNGPAGVADLAVSPNGSDIVLATTVVAGEDLHLDADYADAFVGAHRGVSTDDDGVLLGFDTGMSLQWATYVGGSGAEGGTPSVSRDDQFTFYLGETTSGDAPVPGGFDTTPGGGADAYLAAFSNDGAMLRYASYVGGSADERVGHNALAGSRFELFLGIDTSSSDLPTGQFPGDTSFNGDGGPDCGEGDVWLANVRTGDVTGAQSLFATTYLGGAQGETFGGFSFVTLGGFSGGRVAATLRSYSPDLITRSAAQPSFASPLCSAGSPDRTDAYVAILSSGLLVTDATYLGGSGGDSAIAVAQAPQPVPGAPIMVVGNTTSTGLAVPPDFDGLYHGAGDGFAVAYTADVDPPFPGDGGNTFPDGSPANPDGGIPPGYDEGPSGCCGTSTPAGSTLGLVVGVLFLLFRRRRPR